MVSAPLRKGEAAFGVLPQEQAVWDQPWSLLEIEAAIPNSTYTPT